MFVRMQTLVAARQQHTTPECTSYQTGQEHTRQKRRTQQQMKIGVFGIRSKSTQQWSFPVETVCMTCGKQRFSPSEIELLTTRPDAHRHVAFPDEFLALHAKACSDSVECREPFEGSPATAYLVYNLNAIWVVSREQRGCNERMSSSTY